MQGWSGWLGNRICETTGYEMRSPGSAEFPYVSFKRESYQKMHQVTALRTAGSRKRLRSFYFQFFVLLVDGGVEKAFIFTTNKRKFD